jgi:POT family proton-dependent oligopeptide transporter
MTDTAITGNAEAGAEAFGHPRGLVTLFFTEMWERLSYYGMRALLVLFMTDQVMNNGMGMTDKTATAIYGIYTAGVYLVALPGGWVADRLMGAQRAVFVGGIIIMSGHFVLAVPSVYAFFLGLLLVILGTGLLKPNVSAIVGELYQPGDPRRDGGFTIFYMGINLGAFLGPLICGYLGQSPQFGWHYGFAAAGVGMMFGVVQFWLTRRYLGEAGMHPATTSDADQDAAKRRKGWFAVSIAMLAVAVTVGLGFSGAIQFDPVRIAQQTTALIIIMALAYFAYVLLFGGLDSVEKKRVIVIIFLFFGSAMFWSGFEQAGSSLNLFADRYTVLRIASFPLLSTWFQALNPAFIIIFAPMYAWMWVALAKRNLNPSTPMKFGLGLVILALGFLVMVGAANSVAAGNQVFPTWLFFTYLFHTLGELALSPVGLSATTKLAPKRYVGQMMGIWFLGTALGNVVAGLIAGEFDAENVSTMPGQYMQVVLTTGGAGLIFLLFTKPIKKLMGGVD